MAIDLERCRAFEEEWDQRLGGAGTRPYRELLGFVLARLLTCGAEIEDVLTYSGQCIEEWRRMQLLPQSTEPPS